MDDFEDFSSYDRGILEPVAWFLADFLEGEGCGDVPESPDAMIRLE